MFYCVFMCKPPGQLMAAKERSKKYHKEIKINSSSLKTFLPTNYSCVVTLMACLPNNVEDTWNPIVCLSLFLPPAAKQQHFHMTNLFLRLSSIRGCQLTSTSIFVWKEKVPNELLHIWNNLQVNTAQSLELSFDYKPDLLSEPQHCKYYISKAC